MRKQFIQSLKPWKVTTFLLLSCFSFWTSSLFAQGNEPIKARQSNAIEQNNLQPALETQEEEELNSPADLRRKLNANQLLGDLESEYLRLYQQLNTRTINSKQQNDLMSKYQALNQKDRESVNGLLTSYRIQQLDLNAGNLLEQAYKKSAANLEVNKEMALYNHLLGKAKTRNKHLVFLAAKKAFSEDLLLYAEHLLRSCPANATLIAHAKTDALALLYIQSIRKVRKDITVLSLDWFNSPQYTQRLKSAGYGLPSQKAVDANYLNNFLKMNASKSIALSTSISAVYLNANLNDLYLRGVVFEFSMRPLDQSDVNLDLLQNDFQSLNQTSSSFQYKHNYLPFLIQHYQEVQGENEAQRKRLEKILVEWFGPEQTERLLQKYQLK